MTQTFTAEATCEPTAAALRDALVGIPNHARVTVTRATDQRGGDCLTVKATWAPPQPAVAHGGLTYPPGVRGDTYRQPEDDSEHPHHR